MPEQPSVVVQTAEPEKVTAKGADKGDFSFSSESESGVKSSHAKVAHNAAEVNQRWKQRIKKDGRTVYKLPPELAARGSAEARLEFAKLAEARAYMKEHFPAQMEQHKLTTGKALKPIKATIEPKRTVADFLPADQVQQNHTVASAMQEAMSRQHATQTTGNVGAKDTSAAALLMKPEGAVIEEVPKLDDETLKSLAFKAWQNSKNRLVRACRAEAKKRGLQLTI